MAHFEDEGKLHHFEDEGKLHQAAAPGMFTPFLLVLTLSLFITLDTGDPLQPTTLAKNLR